MTNYSQSREQLQDAFANRFKSEIKKEQNKKASMSAAGDMVIGVMILVAFMCLVGLPELVDFFKSW